jgi:hypothetical protein
VLLSASDGLQKMGLATTQNESRGRGGVSVRIYGLDAYGKPFNTTVSILHVSSSGTLLGGVGINLNSGDLIGVQDGVKKGKCRVRWVGTSAAGTQGQVEVECIEGFNLWGVENGLTSSVTAGANPDRHVIATSRPEQERRNATRYSCDIAVQIGIPGSEGKVWSHCTDISEGGCYIETRSPLAVGVQFQLTLIIEPESLRVDAIVRTSFAGIGMGVQLLWQAVEQIEFLRCYLQQFAAPAPSIVEVPKRNPDVKKLSEYAEQVLDWAETAQLQDSDRQSFEALAVLLRQELQCTRGETNRRLLPRRAPA